MANGETSGRRWSWGGGALHVVHYDKETVAFHEETVSTHVFDEDTYRLVDTLRHTVGSVSNAELWRTAFGVDPSQFDNETLNASLEALLQAGLVSAQPS